MLTRKNGFTLLELLIAAVIIGALAVFASITFRRSASDIRVQDAKVRAQVIAVAARMFKENYPGVTFDTTHNMTSAQMTDKKLTLNDAGTDTDCSPYAQDVSLQTLVSCGYLENRRYVDPNFFFKFQADGSVCISRNTGGSKVMADDTDEYCTNGETGSGTL